MESFASLLPLLHGLTMKVNLLTLRVRAPGSQTIVQSPRLFFVDFSLGRCLPTCCITLSTGQLNLSAGRASWLGVRSSD